MNEYSEKVLLQTVKILDETNINYWVDGGTLLGIIRDNQLLPWDYDIDFSVWSHEVTKDEIVELLKNHGYEYMPSVYEMDCIQFFKDDNRVDIDFYTRGEEVSSVLWRVPSKNIVKRVLGSVILQFYINEKKLAFKQGYNISKIKRMVGKFSVFIPNIILKKLYALTTNLYDVLGSQCTNELLQFKKIRYKNYELSVPIESEKYLEYFYGKDWKVPKKDYDWTTEMTNLTQER